MKSYVRKNSVDIHPDNSDQLAVIEAIKSIITEITSESDLEVCSIFRYLMLVPKKKYQSIVHPDIDTDDFERHIIRADSIGYVLPFQGYDSNSLVSAQFFRKFPHGFHCISPIFGYNICLRRIRKHHFEEAFDSLYSDDCELARQQWLGDLSFLYMKDRVLDGETASERYLTRSTALLGITTDDLQKFMGEIYVDPEEEKAHFCNALDNVSQTILKVFDGS